MINFFRRLSLTIGLIALWAKLYPFILKTIGLLPQKDGLAFGWISPELLASTEFKVGTLLYLTFWFGIYLDGFFNEWSLIRLHQASQILVCLSRWVIQSFLRLMLPFLVSLGMYWGLVRYTIVPLLLQLVTALIAFIILGYLGWFYPSEKVRKIANWKRFS